MFKVMSYEGDLLSVFNTRDEAIEYCQSLSAPVMIELMCQHEAKQYWEDFAGYIRDEIARTNNSAYKDMLNSRLYEVEALSRDMAYG